MNLKQAQYVLAIVEAGSMAAASRELHVTQPALSQVVKTVESETGAPLFERGSKPLRLTWAGTRFCDYARRLVLLDRGFRGEMSDIAGEKSGEFRFGIPSGISRHVMVSLVPCYIARYPHVALRIAEIGSAAIERRLRSGALDMGLLRAERAAPALESVCVQRDHLLLAAGAESDFARAHADGSTVDFAETRGERFLVKRTGNRTRAVFDQLCESAGVRPSVLFEFEQFSTAVLTAASCGALMLASASSLREQPGLRGRVKLYEIAGPVLRYDRFICWPKDLRLPRYMRDWAELLKEIMSN